MKKNNKKYALKEMSKVKIIDRRSEKNIKNEREFLSKLHHPFIVNMACAFQDYDNLYLVMDLLTGGDLRYHLCLLQKFSEEETKFFFACLLLGLEYIHGNNIIHRDIKPENLVCEENGYIRITDFGVAKIKKEDNSSETSGTPGYMAPEVLFGQNHSFPVDFFAIGIMGYEFMFGERPYLGKNRKEIKYLVLKKQAKIKLENVPDGWSYESVDFINKCLKRRWVRRLGGTKGISELKNHSWFRNFNWDKLYNKKKRAPFMPKRGGNYDKKYCEAIEKISDTTKERYQKYKNKTNFLYIFQEYTYINYELIPGNFIETNTRVTTKTTNTKTSKMQSPINHHINNNYDINNDNIFSNKKLSNAIRNFKKHLNDEQIENENEELLINTIRTPQNKNKNENILNMEIDPHFKFKIERNENKPKMFSNNNSIYKSYNNIFYGIKKLPSSTINKIKDNSRSASVDISNSNLKNNLSKNTSHLKYPKKEINMKYNINERSLNDLSSGPLSNPSRDKLTYKLFKSNSGIGNMMLINKNKKKEISVIDIGENNNNNNFLNLKKNNFIQLRKNNNANKFQFYLPNLNKEANLNIQRIKKKINLNLDNMIMSSKNKFLFNNKNNELRTRNKYFLSPTNKILRKSESGFFYKTPMNLSNYDLNHDLNINLKDTGEFSNNNFKNDNNFYSTFIKKNINEFSKRVFKKRKK